jgi:hypothetical protein
VTADDIIMNRQGWGCISSGRFATGSNTKWKFSPGSGKEPACGLFLATVIIYRNNIEGTSSSLFMALKPPSSL